MISGLNCGFYPKKYTSKNVSGMVPGYFFLETGFYPQNWHSKPDFSSKID